MVVSSQPGTNATLTMNPLKRDITNDDLLPLLEVIEEIRVRDPEMTAAVLSIFLYVATHDDCHKQAIEEDLEISTSNCSRAADWLLDKKDPIVQQILSLVRKVKRKTQLYEHKGTYRLRAWMIPGNQNGNEVSTAPFGRQGP